MGAIFLTVSTYLRRLESRQFFFFLGKQAQDHFPLTLVGFFRKLIAKVLDIETSYGPIHGASLELLYPPKITGEAGLVPDRSVNPITSGKAPMDII